jgi:hypothetical protein
LGNCTWRIRLLRDVIDTDASLSALENHFHGRMAAKRNSGKSSIARLKMRPTRTA